MSWVDGILMNASGVHCTYIDELDELYKCKFVGAVVSKSCTTEYRKGNDEPRYKYIKEYKMSINSMGLPNQGYIYYQGLMDRFMDKPYIMSISGLSFNEGLEILNRVCEKEVLMGKKRVIIEFNMSCPNIIQNPKQSKLDETSEAIGELNNTVKKYITNLEELVVGIKLQPYFDAYSFDVIADKIRVCPNIKFITTINSIPNGLYVDIDKNSTVIHPKNGFGGLGGDICKPVALANVRQFYKRLPDFCIIGCGGISTGRDVYEYILCGASAVQIGTTLKEEGIGCFERISKEFNDILLSKKVTIDEVRGKLIEIPAQ